MGASDTWRSLSTRLAGGDEEQTRDEGLPTHLVSWLIEWLGEYAQGETFEIISLAARMKLDLLFEEDYPSFGAEARRFYEECRRVERPDLFLDAVDRVLFALRKSAEAAPKGRRRYLQQRQTEAAVKLERVFDYGGSACRVSDDQTRLEERIDPTIRATMLEAQRTAEQKAPSAAEHLRTAWRASSGRHPDPTKAYSESIKAVEAAAAPVVTPNDALATLGRIRGQLHSAKAEYQFSVANAKEHGAIEIVSDILRLLGEGQTDRHGGSQPTKPVTPEAAKVAVHLAALLVQWFSSGAVRRQTSPPAAGVSGT
ncbi:MAG: hypothetical protein ACR2JY_03260 [Chloroflexota bacterium]